jgi:hypothetical protein
MLGSSLIFLVIRASIVFMFALKSDSTSYRTHLPFDSKVANYPTGLTDVDRIRGASLDQSFQ